MSKTTNKPIAKKRSRKTHGPEPMDVDQPGDVGVGVGGGGAYAPHTTTTTSSTNNPDGPITYRRPTRAVTKQIGWMEETIAPTPPKRKRGKKKPPPKKEPVYRFAVHLTGKLEKHILLQFDHIFNAAKRLVRLPKPKEYCVETILDEFLEDYLRREDCQMGEKDPVWLLHAEGCHVLKSWFDALIFRQLLTTCELPQAADLLKAHPNKSSLRLYGAEHFLRLLGKLTSFFSLFFCFVESTWDPHGYSPSKRHVSSNPNDFG